MSLRLIVHPLSIEGLNSLVCAHLTTEEQIQRLLALSQQQASAAFN